MTSLFNRQRVDEYIRFFGKEKICKLFRLYLTETKKQMSRLPDLLQQNKKEETKRLFHNLKSSSAAFGLDKFSQLCTKINDYPEISEERDILPAQRLWQKSIRKVCGYLNTEFEKDDRKQNGNICQTAGCDKTAL